MEIILLCHVVEGSLELSAKVAVDPLWRSKNTNPLVEGLAGCLGCVVLQRDHELKPCIPADAVKCHLEFSSWFNPRKPHCIYSYHLVGLEFSWWSSLSGSINSFVLDACRAYQFLCQLDGIFVGTRMLEYAG